MIPMARSIRKWFISWCHLFNCIPHTVRFICVTLHGIWSSQLSNLSLWLTFVGLSEIFVLSYLYHLIMLPAKPHTFSHSVSNSLFAIRGLRCCLHLRVGWIHRSCSSMVWFLMRLLCVVASVQAGSSFWDPCGYILPPRYSHRGCIFHWSQT